MSEIFRFYGHSDDCLEIEVQRPSGEVFLDEQYVKGDGTLALELTAPNGERMGVVAMYGKSGASWCFAPAMADEGVPIPAWPNAITAKHDYSLELEIVAPDGTTLHSETESERRSMERVRVWPPQDKETK